jgi:hypothetical protein
MAAVGDHEPVDLREFHRLRFPVQMDGFGELLVPDVRQPLEEEEWKDVRLPVGPVDRAAT